MRLNLFFKKVVKSNQNFPLESVRRLANPSNLKNTIGGIKDEM